MPTKIRALKDFDSNKTADVFYVSNKSAEELIKRKYAEKVDKKKSLELCPDKKSAMDLNKKISKDKTVDVEVEKIKWIWKLFELGLSIIPLGVNKKNDLKAPSLSKWGKYSKKQATKKEIQGWIDQGLFKNIGVIGGKVSGNLVFFDFDEPESFKKLELSTQTLIKDGAWVTATPGEEGRYHVITRDFKDIKTTKKVGNGIEFRCNNHYCVVYPSTHPNGKQYNLLNTHNPEELELPTQKDTLEIWKNWQKHLGDEKVDGDGGGVAVADGSADYPECIKKAFVTPTKKPMRYYTLYALASHLRQRNIPRDLTEKKLKDWNLKFCNPPHSNKIVEQAISGGYKTDQNKTGCRFWREDAKLCPHENQDQCPFYNPKKQEEKTIILTDEDEGKKEEKMRDPNLLVDTVKEIQRNGVAGEEDTIIAQIIVASTRLVKNAIPESTNLLLSDKTGLGKDHVTKKTLEVIIPDEEHLHVTKMTPESFTYWHYKDDGWRWDNKVIHFEDVTQQLLNCPTFKSMSSGGSFAVVVKEQKTIEIPIPGKPCMILTSHHANPRDEALRRFRIGALNDTDDQTRAIKDKISTQYIGNKKITPDYVLRSAVQSLKPYPVIIPYAGLIQHFFPDDSLMRTHYHCFLDYICGSAIFHQCQREKNVDGSLIATPDDYMIALMILIYTTSNPKMIPMSREYRDIIEILKDNVEGMTVKELDIKCSQSRPWLYKHLPNLVATGLVSKGKIHNESANKDVITYGYADVNPNVIPTWDEIGRKIEDIVNKTNNTNKTTQDFLLEKWFSTHDIKPIIPKNEKDGFSLVLYGHIIPFNGKVLSVLSVLYAFLRERDEKRYKRYYEERKPEPPEQEKLLLDDRKQDAKKMNDSADFRNKYGRPLDQDFFNEYYNMNFGESEDKIYGDLVIIGILDFMSKDELRYYVKKAITETAGGN